MIAARRLAGVAHVAALALLAAASSSASPPPRATSATAAGATASTTKPRFGPFDAGTARPVTRHGDKGRARRPHPVVGAVDHIPGAGPPPPPLRSDPYLPEAGGDERKGANVVGGGLSSNPLYLASLLYSNFLTRTDGPRCQHLPTCSRFANQAVARHGVLGIAMGLDRLLQPSSSSSLRMLPEVDWSGSTRFFDPVENYEFWRAERFSGFPPHTAEEPLTLPAAAPTSLVPPSTSPAPGSVAGAPSSSSRGTP
jgi:putative component of membrane protein insertase Oxa1/YidC/SpoIIIJ protein YidD